MSLDMTQIHNSCPSCGRVLGVHAPKAKAHSRRAEDLLHSNDAPLDLESARFRDVIDSGQRRITILEEKISKARNALHLLLDERDKTVQEVKDSRTILHPLRRLPGDILCEIFIMCIDEEPGTEMPYSSLDTTKAPWSLVQVSSRWRNVGISYPRLWSSFHVNLDNIRDNDHSAATFLLGLHLDRSRSHPLSLSLRSSHEISANHPLLQPLLSCSSRWTTLFVSLPLNSFASLSSTRGFLPSLHTLNIQATGEYDDESRGQLTCDAFEFAPQLRKIWISNIPDIVDLFLIPWGQIKELEVFEAHNLCHLELLTIASNVERCILSGALDEDLFLDTTVHLQHLHTLWIVESDDSGPGSIAQLLRSLTIPALKVLHLSFRGECDDDDIEDYLDFVAPFLEQSQCSLEELWLSLPWLAEEQLKAMLRASPTLQKLSIRSRRPITTKVIEQLIYLPKSGALVPRLEFIDLRGSQLGFSGDTITRVIESRWQSSTCGGYDGAWGKAQRPPLLSVRLPFTIPFNSPGLPEKMQQMINGGLDIRFGDELQRCPITGFEGPE